MTFPGPALFIGQVIHRRVFPRRHSLRYRVFSVLVDLDTLDETVRGCRLLSHNRWNLFSLHDRDHGDGTTDDLAGFVRKLVDRRLGMQAKRVLMFCFPRVLGYVFNPLTVYFCLDGDGRVIAVVHEVNNTFGGRTHYVCRVDGDAEGGGVSVQGAAKHLIVSPFNAERGQYGFRLCYDDDRLTIGVAVREAGRALMNASYASSRLALSDANILRLAATVPLMTLKVIAAIHFEAIKLWLKGLRPPSPVRASVRGRHDHLIGDQGVALQSRTREI